jgi:Na+/H+ antiporter NhaA
MSDFVFHLDVGGSIVLTLILGKQDGVVWTGFIWLRIRISVGSCEEGI